MVRLADNGLTIGSLFSGIGGLDLGLEMCGQGPVIWQCDSDPFARAVLETHWPGVKRYNDVREIDGRAARPDIICGGFPCQPVSVAGKRKAQKDTRWLWPHFAAAVAAVRPSVVFIENVPGLRGSGLRDVLADLAALGFDAEWGDFSAEEVGAPHRRKRLFVLAHAGRLQLRHERRWSGGEGGEGAPVVAADGGPGDVAHAHGQGELQQGGPEPAQRRRPSRRRAEGDVANTDGLGKLEPHQAPPPISNRRQGPWDATGRGGERLADANGAGLAERGEQRAQNEQPAAERGGPPRSAWPPEPDVGRVAHGVPQRVHRLRLLGNACVPAQAALAWLTLTARAKIA